MVPALPATGLAVMRLGAETIGKDLASSSTRNDLEELLEIVSSNVRLWAAFIDAVAKVSPSDTVKMDRAVATLEQAARGLDVPRLPPALRAVLEAMSTIPLTIAALERSASHQESDKTASKGYHDASAAILHRSSRELLKCLACMLGAIYEPKAHWLDELLPFRAAEAASEALRWAASLPEANVPEELVPLTKREPFLDMVGRREKAFGRIAALSGQVVGESRIATVDGD